jgi:AcrR family transcriptional regulator
MSAPDTKPVPTAGGRRMSPDARRAQIIASARDVFLRHGFVGTRVRDIAEQAGITENLIYIRFSTKAEIYQAAVTDPLDALVDQLVEATSQLSAEPGANRLRMFERFHQVLLSSMLDTAPLLAVALFSNPVDGRRYYSEVVLPRFTEAITTVISDVTGWPLDSLQLDVLVEGVLGLHFGMALDSIFDERTVDVPDVARQLGIMFGSGIVARPGAIDPVTPAEPGPAAVTESETDPDIDTEPRVRMQAAERRASIARAAREVFVERGPAGARTREIAERAGITEAFMFRVFGGKEELYRAAVEEPAEALLERLEAEIREATSRGGSGTETLRAVNERGIAVFSELAPIVVVALFSDMHRGRAFYRRSVNPLFRRVQTYLAGVAGWDTSDVDPEILSRALFGIQFGTVLHHLLTEHPIDAADTARRLTRLIAAGIR